MGGRIARGALAALMLALSAAPAAAACQLDRLASLPVTMTGMRPSVPVYVNGQEARLFVDTGGAFGLFTPDAAARLKLKVVPTEQSSGWIMGATGPARLYYATVETLSLVGFPIHKAAFMVGGGSEGQVDGALGQDILGGMEAEYDLANGVIRFFSATDCKGQALAYWDKDQTYSDLDLDKAGREDRRIQVMVQVNGQPIRAELDSGTPRSILSARAAERIGIGPKSKAAVAAGLTRGIGGQPVDTWLAPVDSFKVGQEEIQHTRLRIAEIKLDRAEMLLGADFFLSHRIFVSRSQAKVYLTYNGGPVFRLDKADDPAPAGASPPSAPAQTQAAAAPLPADADGGNYARRGAALMARNDFTGAEAAYTRALELEPRDFEHFVDRAAARAAAGRTGPAIEDLDQALKLKPDDKDALLSRGTLRLKAKDEPGARADLEALARLDAKYRFSAARAYEGASLFPAAVAQYDAWIADHPKDKDMAAALNGRCWARALGAIELDKALADCQAALKLAPDAPNVLDSRGLARLRLGQLDKAIDDYNRVLRVWPKTAWSLYGRGLARLRMGLKAEGEADLKAAAAADPELPETARRYGLAP